MFGFVVRRLRGRLPLATAALLTVLITTAVLTALVAFNAAVGDAGLRRALQHTDHARTLVVLSGDRESGTRAADDTAVTGFADQLFPGLPHTVTAAARSRALGLTATAAPGKDPDLTLIAALDRNRTTLVAGSWPAPAAGKDGPVEVAVPQAALAGTGLAGAALPARLDLTDRFTGRPVTVRVTGVYRPADKDAAYWRLDPLGGQGAQRAGFTTYGPLLADDSVFTTGAVAQAGRSWLVEADFTGIDAAGAEDLRDAVDPLTRQVQRAAAVRVDTALPQALRELAVDATVSRSTLLVGALQLGVLAAAALLLVVHLLADRQTAENQLLTARGASRRRIGTLTAVEAALLVLPAALLAPPLTPLLLRLLTARGPLAAVSTGTAVPGIAWPVAAGCALACVALTAVPVLLRSAGAAVLRRAGRRQAVVAAVARSGGDLALVALAVLAYRQLDRYGGGVGPDADGRIGADPLLVAAPTLALCAGTVLVLRLLPFAARLGERLATRGRGLAPALAGWQFARRPGRGVGPVLLLVLAVSIGMLAIGQRTTWNDSQRDQADFATAGGVRIAGSAVPAAGRGGLYRALPGGERLIPVARSEVRLPDRSSGELLALDSRAGAAWLQVRSDLLDGRSPAQLLGPLAAPAPTGPQAGLPLPGSPQRIDLDVTTHVVSRGFLFDPVGDLPAPSSRTVALRLMLRDAYGTSFWAAAPTLQEEGAQHVSIDLGELFGAPTGAPATPLTVVAVEAESTLRPDETISQHLTVDRISAADTATGTATPVPVPAGLGWALAAEDRQGRVATKSVTVRTEAEHPIVLDFTNTVGGGFRMTLTPADAAGRAAAVPELTGVATRGYLTAVGGRVGDRIKVPVGTTSVQVTVTAAVEALPTAAGSALLVDLGALDRVLSAARQPGPTPTEWWLPAAGPGDPAPAQAAQRLRALPQAQSLTVRDELAAQLRADPLGAAPQSALAALAVAAAVLAAIGFAAASAAAAGERTAEFAVLMALGAPRRRLVRTVAAEQGVLALLGLGVGLGLGTLLVHLVVPLLVLTPAARPPVPEVLVRLPFGQVAALAAAIATALVLPALLAGRRHRDLTARLRHVEEM
ncbi:FtsX-like permease family protein [Kitasatospora cinereorecta]|uniref:FtsX-like permease family protein n=1 Tax=Kitasatospora cinereorecta TaxID=285560 RepID=UPI0031F7A421